MSKQSKSTKEKILRAANILFYGEGIRAVSVDAIAEKAGVTKKTLYYHFRSKDDLITAYLESRDLPHMRFFQKWFEEADGTFAQKIGAIFSNLAIAAKHPKWKGCGFVRTVAELVNTPGHPALEVGAAHKIKLENWLHELIEEQGIKNAHMRARQIKLLIEGALSAMLVHRDPVYFQDAGTAAETLLSCK